MATISILRSFIKNGWTICNRKNIISKIGKNNFNEITQLAKKTGRTGDQISYKDANNLLQTYEMPAIKEGLQQTNTAYHGSPFNFNFFDIAKIGTGEGMNKYGQGLYLARTKRIAPFYSNIRSKDAPLHFGATKHLENTTPTVYTVQGIDNLNLKLVSPLEAKRISASQVSFQTQNPNIDGIEFLNGEITVFPKSVNKLSIVKKENVIDFVKNNKNYNFREWTTDKSKLECIYKT